MMVSEFRSFVVLEFRSFVCVCFVGFDLFRAVLFARV